MSDRLLLDTSFIQALLNSKDRHHQQARILLPKVYNAREVWVTEAVLVEVGNAFSAMNRSAVLLNLFNSVIELQILRWLLSILRFWVVLCSFMALDQIRIGD